MDENSNGISYASKFVLTGTEKLHYLETGNGACLLLVFHGYAQGAQGMLPFAAYLNEGYTCLFFDLPHHGRSVWKDSSTLTPNHLKEMVQQLMQMYHVTKVSLLGYSIGARICLSILEKMPQHVARLTLLSPDGLIINPYYYFFTNTLFGDFLFRSALQAPQRYFPMAVWLKNMRLIDAGQIKYIRRNIKDTQLRRLLSLLWPALGEILPSQASVAQAMELHGIPLHVFIGKYDRLIPAEPIIKICRGQKTCTLHVLNKGHRVFDHSNLESIAQTLLIP